jgi:heptosyltransferase-2
MQPTSFRGKILVIRGGAIGDFILTLPAIAALRSHFPEAYLEVLGYPHIVQLAEAGGLVNAARSIDARPLAAFFARGGDLTGDMVDYFSEFDLIVSYLYDPDHIFRNNVGRCSPAQFIPGPHRPEAASQLHASKVYLQPLERLAIFEADPVPRLSLAGSPPGPEPERTSEMGPTLALHPGSGSERKNWPEARWAELLEQIVHASSLNLLLIGGEAEGERLQRLAAALPPTRTRVAQSWPLARLGRELARSDAFVGHDSGISHLAAALGLPALLLWGDSDETIWRPPGQNAVLLRSEYGLSHLPANEVWEQINSITALQPAFR